MKSQKEALDLIEITYNSLGFMVGVLRDSPKSLNELIDTNIGKIYGYCAAKNWYLNPVDLEKISNLKKN